MHFHSYYPLLRIVVRFIVPFGRPDTSAQPVTCRHHDCHKNYGSRVELSRANFGTVVKLQDCKSIYGLRG